MRRVLVEAAACAVATLGAGLLYREYFATPDYLLPMLIASLGGALGAAVAATRQWSFARSFLLAFGGFLLLACYSVFGATVASGLPTRETATELLWGVVGGWARMLTVGLPADVRGELLVTPVLLAWTAAFVGVTLAVRTRSVLAPVTPPLVSFVVALLFVGNRPGVQLAATATFLGGVLVLILLRANRNELAFGVPVIIGVAGLGIAGWYVLPLASGDDRFDPRDLHPPPVQIADTLTPLAKIKSQLREQPPKRLFTVYTEPGQALDRIRIAALGEYDGTLWTSADEFVVAGHRLAADEILTKTKSMPARIEIDGLSGPFLPALGRPAQLELADGESTSQFGFSISSGVLATTKTAPRGLRYATVSELAVRDTGLPLALPSAAPEFLHYTDLPGDLPPRLRELIYQLTDPEPTPYGKLLAIERYLRSLPYGLDAEPGHSYGALTRLMTESSPGYAEQHAAAFAVLARAAGFPTRVAVGYRLPENRDGVHIVTTSEAHAWAEVAFDGYGWVSFEPTDVTQLPQKPQTRQNNPVAGPPEPNPPEAAPAIVGPPLGSDGPPGSGWGGVLQTTVVTLIGLVSVLLIAAASAAVVKTRRRWRRRRAADRSVRVLGAWREANDRLVEHGVVVPISSTANETAQTAVETLGTGAVPMVSLAPLATAAVFAPDTVTDHQVERAWQLETQLRRGLVPRRLSVLWLRAGLDPRPLLAGWREARQSRKSLRGLGVG